MAFSFVGESTKGRVLSVLRDRSCGTAQDVAEALGITAPAARRHLTDLQSAGLLVSRVEKPAGRGRPQHVFALTPDGEDVFPKRYAQLCADILDHVQSLYGEGAILEVLSARNVKLEALWAGRVVGDTLEDRLESLVAVLCECGYQARALRGDDGALYLDEHNCPSLEVARQYGQLCQSEAELYARLLGAPVARETQISRGAPSCRYRVV